MFKHRDKDINVLFSDLTTKIWVHLPLSVVWLFCIVVFLSCTKNPLNGRRKTRKIDCIEVTLYIIFVLIFILAFSRFPRKLFSLDEKSSTKQTNSGQRQHNFFRYTSYFFLFMFDQRQNSLIYIPPPPPFVSKLYMLLMLCIHYWVVGDYLVVDLCFFPEFDRNPKHGKHQVCGMWDYVRRVENKKVFFFMIEVPPPLLCHKAIKTNSFPVYSLGTFIYLFMHE